MKYIIAILIVLIIILFYNRGDSVFNKIYLDNNGTTELDPEAKKYLINNLDTGNISASYNKSNIIPDFNNLINQWTNKNYKIIYTSGCSESNNTILNLFNKIETSSYEHSSLYNKAKQMKCRFIYPDHNGIINPDKIIKTDAELISIMHVNNEIGSINNIALLAKLAKLINPKIYFHTDMAQSFGKIPVDFTYIDSVSASAHKFNGCLGVGLLLVIPELYNKIQNKPLIHGTQNDFTRGGTINYPAIAASYIAFKNTIKNRPEKNQDLLNKKRYLINLIINDYNIGDFKEYYNKPDYYYKPGQGSEIVFLNSMNPNSLTFSIVKYGELKNHFCNIKLRNDLEEFGIIVSIGSACHANSREPSHVLTSIRAPFIIRCGIIRISMSNKTSYNDLYNFYKKFKELTNKQINE